MAIKRVREPSPLRVWLAIVPLVAGGGAYAAGVAVMEYFMAAAGLISIYEYAAWLGCAGIRRPGLSQQLRAGKAEDNHHNC